MMSYRNIFHAAACLMAISILLPCTATARDVSLEASINVDQVFIGETVSLTVKVDGYESGLEPDLSAIPGCTVDLRGHTDKRFHNISILNGHREIQSFSGRIFQYAITPTRKGTQTLGPIVIKDGRTTVASIRGPEITVQGIEKQKQVTVFLDASATNVIVDQPFSVTLRVRVQKLPQPYRDSSPLPTEQPPRLRIPYLRDKAFKGLKGPDIKPLLDKRLIRSRRQAGLAINDYTIEKDLFDSFFNMRSLQQREQPARFDLNPKSIRHQGKPYFEYSLSLDYQPIQEGSYTFGPISFKGPVFVRANRDGRGITQSIYTIADSITVHVVPPPREGRPASYVGAIGHNLTATASLDTQTCKVGDPLTLDIVIGGDIRIDNLSAPRLGLQKALGDHFKIYEDTVRGETRDDTRSYTYTVRPTKAGTLEIPPIDVSYYNIDTRTYATATTDPIPVRANPAAVVEDSIVINTPDQSVTIHAEDSDPNRRVPAPVALPLASTQSETLFLPARHIPLLLAGPLLFVFGIAFQMAQRRMPDITRRQRQRHAASAAKTHIQNANPRSVHYAIASGLRNYVAMRLDIQAAGLTPSEWDTVLKQHGISHACTSRFVTLLQRNFDASFQGDDQPTKAIQNDLRDACAVIDEMESELTHRPTQQRRGPGSWIQRWIGLLLLAALVPHAGHAAPAAGDFESQLATSQLLTANTPHEFTCAAQSLKRVIDAGGRNAELFYNYGTALLMAGAYKPALAALRRAERYSGATWALQRNMLIATAKLSESPSTPTLPWYRVPLFWHFGLAGQTRITVASCAFLFIWIGLLLKRFGYRDSGRTLAAIAFVVLILFGSSVITTLYQEHHAYDTTPVTIKSKTGISACLNPTKTEPACLSVFVETTPIIHRKAKGTQRKKAVFPTTHRSLHSLYSFVTNFSSCESDRVTS